LTNIQLITVSFYIQTLKKPFADYIRKSCYQIVRLYGPAGNEINAQVLKRKHGRVWKVKFGTKWKAFVFANAFVPGDKLNFKFVNNQESNIIRVIKHN
jgi:hypothetical protein